MLPNLAPPPNLPVPVLALSSEPIYLSVEHSFGLVSEFKKKGQSKEVV